MYHKKDFAACKYNPLEEGFSIIYSDLMKCIPSEYEGDGEKLLKYVCLMYDPNSKLIRDTSSMEQRKRMAAQYAGYDLTEAGKEVIEKIFELTDEAVVTVIDYFLKFEIKERLWYLIQGNEQTFHEYGKRLLMPITWDDKSKERDLLSATALKTKLSQDMTDILARLESDYQKFYAYDEDLLKVVAKKKFSPENQASRIK